MGQVCREANLYEAEAHLQQRVGGSNRALDLLLRALEIANQQLAMAWREAETDSSLAPWAVPGASAVRALLEEGSSHGKMEQVFQCETNRVIEATRAALLICQRISAEDGPEIYFSLFGRVASLPEALPWRESIMGQVPTTPKGPVFIQALSGALLAGVAHAMLAEENGGGNQERLNFLLEGIVGEYGGAGMGLLGGALQEIEARQRYDLVLHTAMNAAYQHKVVQEQDEKLRRSRRGHVLSAEPWDRLQARIKVPLLPKIEAALALRNIQGIATRATAPLSSKDPQDATEDEGNAGFAELFSDLIQRGDKRLERRSRSRLVAEQRERAERAEGTTKYIFRSVVSPGDHKWRDAVGAFAKEHASLRRRQRPMVVARHAPRLEAAPHRGALSEAEALALFGPATEDQLV